MTVFATDETIKNVQVSLELSNGIEVIGKKTTQLQFQKTGEQMAYFELDVTKANGINTVKVIAASGAQKGIYDVEIDVVNPNPISSKLISKKLEKGSRIVVVVNVNKNNNAQINYGTGKDVNKESIKDAEIPLEITFTGRSSISLPIWR